MKKIIIVLILFIIIPCVYLFSQQATSDQKIEGIIHQMTLEEKIDFIGGYNQFSIRSIERLGIPEIHMSDGPVGVRNFGPSTAYPASITLAASWDTAIAARVGKAIADEAKSRNVQVMLGPGMNIYRAPMCGRNFEYLGEDPFLAGKIALSYIKGMQNEGVMATAKHYMANNQEYDRNNVSSDMDERTLREIYLPAFKTSVVEGKVACVMTSYNPINGIHASQNDYLINKILKNEWGFTGIVMSDWGSTYDGVEAANAGLDIEMPSGAHMNRDTLMPAIMNGRLSVAIVDEKIRRILRTCERFGYFKNSDTIAKFVLDSANVRETAIDAARGGIVLLKNEQNILPIDKSKVKSIALIGPNVQSAVTGGGGSSFVQPLHPLSIYQALSQLAGSKIKINYEPGIYGRESMPEEFFNHSDFYTYVNNNKVPGLKADYYSKRRAEGNPDSSQIFPKINSLIKRSIQSEPRSSASIRFSGFLKVNEGGTYRFVVSSNAGYRLSINDKQIVGSWHNDVETSRSGLITLEPGKEYKIELTEFQHEKEAIIRMSYETPEVYLQNVAYTLKKVVSKVFQSDLTILCLGFNSETEHEGADRSFSLPDEQLRLIDEVIKTNKDFVVILNAGGNVDMNNWLDKSKGLIHTWYPGQEGTLAVAEILLGITNPSGKIPVSFEKRWKDNAAFNNYYDKDGDKHARYSEGIFMGYRHFDKENIEPQFPFGFGLSYTTFEYSNLVVNKKNFSENDPIEITLIVKNTGKYNGAEIVQLYIGDPVSSLPRPVKELKAFNKVWLNAGESKNVNFILNADAFQYFNPEMKKWIEEPGDFDILIGSSSRDIRLKERVKISDK